ncbi:flavin reductase family protein [Glaciecola petra]|uniref:Flavin reductase family protein n=1 Tax=Glaciecola petra TaxID=3075602 RepID=A0ABU2ZU55_9ALTE|nr:flavin reductase family protein [Aestuariibacter sp. P117]MDT0595114.1 flavin reductase family protein [Aestuariibacter sp. P117]
MNIDLQSLSSTQIYHLMTQTVIPRPIAWVLSRNNDDKRFDMLNLAPFSYFNAVSSDPPLCILSMGKKPDGKVKDTAANLPVGAHCIVHIASAENAKTVTATAATLDYGVSELEQNNIKTIDHENWLLPRIENCPIAYYCKVHSTQDIGNAPQRLVFVEVLEVYVSDSVSKQDDNGRIVVDAMATNPLARLGANQYAILGSVLDNKRPK